MNTAATMNPTPCTSPATEARKRLGLTPEAAARQLRISPRYLRAVERGGGASYALAERAARLYQCDIAVFLYSSGNN